MIILLFVLLCIYFCILIAFAFVSFIGVLVVVSVTFEFVVITLYYCIIYVWVVMFSFIFYYVQIEFVPICCLHICLSCVAFALIRFGFDDRILALAALLAFLPLTCNIIHYVSFCAISCVTL